MVENNAIHQVLEIAKEVNNKRNSNGEAPQDIIEEAFKKIQELGPSGFNGVQVHTSGNIKGPVTKLLIDLGEKSKPYLLYTIEHGESGHRSAALKLISL